MKREQIVERLKGIEGLSIDLALTVADELQQGYFDHPWPPDKEMLAYEYRRYSNYSYILADYVRKAQREVKALMDDIEAVTR